MAQDDLSFGDLSGNSRHHCWSAERDFLEHGPVEEVLMDNGAAFCSKILRETLGKWNPVKM